MVLWVESDESATESGGVRVIVTIPVVLQPHSLAPVETNSHMHRPRLVVILRVGLHVIHSLVIHHHVSLGVVSLGPG